MIYVHASLVICIFGVISNGCMAILLSRPRLATTINRLLALVTGADALLMCSHAIYLIHFDLVPASKCPVDMLSYGWVLFQLLHTNWSVYLRAVSLWVSVAMAGYRKHVLSKTKPRRHEKSSLPIRMGLGVAACVFLICLPIFLQNTIEEGPMAPENNTVCPKNHSVYYVVSTTELAMWKEGLLLKAAYWTNGILLKLCPLSFLTYYLVRVVLLMYARHKRRQKTLFKNRGAGTGTSSTLTTQQQRNNAESNTNQQQQHRSVMMPTSMILVTVLLMTVVCEMPNAILSVMTGLFPDLFIRNAYSDLGEVMDFLSLFSCSSTSILYFVMSQSLRKAFVDVFCSTCLRRSLSGKNSRQNSAESRNQHKKALMVRKDEDEEEAKAETPANAVAYV